MKTKQTTQRKEQQEQEIQKDHTDSNRHLEDDEKIFYSESVENSGDSLAGIATTLFLIFGFPFYTVIGFTALTAYLSERSLNEFGQEIMWPAVILLVVAGASIALAMVCKAFYRTTLGGHGTKFLITNKRIYNYNPNSLIPVMFECRYPDVLYVYPEKMGKHEYLQVRAKERETCEDGSTRIIERRHAFRVKNAKKSFMQIPDDVRWERGEKSKNGAIYKAKTKKEAVFALTGLALMVLFLAFVVITVHIQVTAADLVGQGKRLVKQGQFVEAEKVFRQAYQKVSFFPFYPDLGPVAYKYAHTLQTNGKPDAAIPLYLQAIEHCNWSDVEEDITWKPAVFRSNVHLAEIYVQKKNDHEAERYFDQALAAAPLETDENQVKSLFSDYQYFLSERAKGGKAAMVNRLAGMFTVSKQGVRTFSDWSDR